MCTFVGVFVCAYVCVSACVCVCVRECVYRYGSNSNVVLKSLYVLSLFPALPFLLEVLDS